MIDLEMSEQVLHWHCIVSPRRTEESLGLHHTTYSLKDLIFIKEPQRFRLTQKNHDAIYHCFYGYGLDGKCLRHRSSCYKKVHPALHGQG